MIETPDWKKELKQRAYLLSVLDFKTAMKCVENLDIGSKRQEEYDK